MKEMIYNDNENHINENEILLEGIFNGYHFVIINNQGTHPCAYVELPETHVYYGKDYDEISIECHGGLTYSGRNNLCNIKCSNPIEPHGFYIGWDYVHSGDLYACDSSLNNIYENKYKKKWTTEEIFIEVMSVISQLELADKKNREKTVKSRIIDYVYTL